MAEGSTCAPDVQMLHPRGAVFGLWHVSKDGTANWESKLVKVVTLMFGEIDYYI